jgi:hypothetical protein
MEVHILQQEQQRNITQQSLKLLVDISVVMVFIQKIADRVVYQIQQLELVTEISQHMQQKIQEAHIQELGLQHGINQLQ